MEDPTIHDPEALRVILASMKRLKSLANVSSIVVAASVKAAVDLLEQEPQHLEHCEVSRAVYDILKAAAAISGDTMAGGRVATYTGQSVERPDGFYSRIVDTMTNRVAGGPFGPFRTEQEAIDATETGMREMLASIGMDEVTVTEIPRDAFAPKSRAVH